MDFKKTLLKKTAFLFMAISPSLLSTTLNAGSIDNDVEWYGVYSDTTSNFVSPAEFKPGDKITIKLRASASDLSAVNCKLFFNGGLKQKTLAMKKTTATNGSLYDTWSATLRVPSGATSISYRFELTDGTDTDYYDAGSPSDFWNIRGMSDESRGESYTFNLLPNYFTPSWSKSAIFYQIFPDRFYDANPDNNSVFPDDCFWYLDYAPASPEALACSSYDVPEEPANYEKFCMVHTDWSESPNGGPCDFFGGDIQGITEKIDYLSDLNITALYLNPIFRSASNHKYDTMDYTSIDPRFGTVSDMDTLMSSVRNKNMKLILDGVFNHESDLGKHYNLWGNYSYNNGTASGYDFYKEDCGVWEGGFLKQCSSEYSDLFKIWSGTDTYDVDRDGNTSEAAAHTCGWYGYEFMPEIDYKQPSQSNSDARVWLYAGSSSGTLESAKNSITGQWTSDLEILSKGVDGWRLDVPDNAGYYTSSSQTDCTKTRNDKTIWQGFRSATKTISSEKYIVGEIWNDATASGGVNWLSNIYDGVMNYYYFGMPMSCFITGVGVHNASNECASAYAPLTYGSSTSVDSLDAHLAKQRRLYYSSSYLSSQNMLSSHDTSRFLSRAGGNLAKLKEAVLFQATLPGAPMIYYGDEAGVTGVTNEEGRSTLPWDVLEDTTSTASQIHKYTKQMMCIRSSYTSLQTGSFVTLWTNNSEKTYSYGRFDSKSKQAIAINNDTNSHTLNLMISQLDGKNGDVYVDILTGSSYTVANNTLSVTLSANAGAILTPSQTSSIGISCTK